MEEYMNSPIEREWTDHDVITEYQRYYDKRKVARIYNISVKDLNQILKKNGVT